MKIFRNNKNKRLYEVLHIAKDCTNAREGGTVVVYQSRYKNSQVYCRDKEEFDQKFTEVKS